MKSALVVFVALLALMQVQAENEEISNRAIVGEATSLDVSTSESVQQSLILKNKEGKNNIDNQVLWNATVADDQIIGNTTIPQGKGFWSSLDPFKRAGTKLG